MSLERHLLRRLRQSMVAGVVAHYDVLGLEHVDDVPMLVPITGACENVATLYSLARHRNLYLSQTGQLSLEMELQRASGGYCVVSSFRADRADARHLNEFRLIEEEFTVRAGGLPGPYDPHAFFDVLLDRIGSAIRAMLRGALETAGEVRELGGDPGAVELALAVDPWPAVTYRDALVLLERDGRFGPLTFGTDLGPAEEARLVELISAEHGVDAVPVFVTHYPEHIKFFNMKSAPEDPSVVLSADLLLPTAGESVGAAVREDDHAMLVSRLRRSSMLRQLELAAEHEISDFEPYLNVVASGRVPPHAGYGIGLERVLQFVLGCEDIRQVSGIHQLAALLTSDVAQQEVP